MKLKWWHIGLGVCFIVAALSPLASPSPDGLEKVAESGGFIDRAKAAPFQLVADYLFPGIKNEAVATILAALIGTLILFGVVYGVAWLVIHRKKNQETISG